MDRELAAQLAVRHGEQHLLLPVAELDVLPDRRGVVTTARHREPAVIASYLQLQPMGRSVRLVDSTAVDSAAEPHVAAEAHVAVDSGRLRKIAQSLTPREWAAAGGMTAAVLALHVIGWGVLLL